MVIARRWWRVRPAAAFAAERLGGAILEFAIALPLVIVLVAGCFEVARGLVAYVAVERSVAAGARYLARVAEPGCDRGCSPGASRAVDLARRQIVSDTGLAPENVRVSTSADRPAGTVELRADVDFGPPLFAAWGFGRWRVSVSRQEQHVAP